MLTLPEEILLLALHDEEGRFVDLPERALDFAVAGAVLMELCMQRRLDADLDRLVVADATPLGDDILDPALTAIAAEPGEHAAGWWLAALAHEVEAIRTRAFDRLEARGILRRENQLLRWMHGRRYPLLDDREQREVKARLLEILRTDEIPGPEDVALIALGDACAVFDEILGMDEMLDVRPRIAEIARMDLLALAMARALRRVQAKGLQDDGPRLGIYAGAADESSRR